MFDGRKILVTGGAGFIGSHLVERLVGLGAEVTTLDRNPRTGLRNLDAVLGRVAAVELDILRDDVADLLAGGRFELIFHLASSASVEASVEDPWHDFERNAAATLRLLGAMRRAAPRASLLYASSAVVYSGGGTALIGEDDPTVPGSPYGVSKLAAERYVNIFARMYGLSGAVLRLFSVFGPRLRKQLIYDIMRRLAERPEALALRGDGTQRRDLSYVANAVDALLLVAERAPLRGEAYNVASGEHPTVREIAVAIAACMGLDPHLEFSGEVTSGDTPHWFADTTRLRALGYAPAIPLQEGLAYTVAWFQDSERAALAPASATPAPRLEDAPCPSAR